MNHKTTLDRAIWRIQRLRDDAQAYLEEYDRPDSEVEGGWLDDDGSIKDWESGEEYHAALATVAAYDKAIETLLSLAREEEA